MLTKRLPNFGNRRGSALLEVGDEVRSLTLPLLPAAALALGAWLCFVQCGKLVIIQTPHVVSYVQRGAAAPYSNEPAFIRASVIQA